MPTVHFDPITRTAHHGGHQAELTSREGEAFAYLAARLGQVISRAELEREVWNMAPGVRSETVPVTMRNLRRKLTWNGLSFLETVRGRGYRLLIPEQPARRVGVPEFPTPYQVRPDEEAALRALIDGSWRVITVIGPEGAGKTRLAAAVAAEISEPVAFCELSGDPGGVEQDLIRGVGLEGNDLADLDRLDEPLWILVDGVGRSEAVWGEVRRLVRQVRSPRFLITSTRPLDLAEEALHTVGPLDGEAGRRFLQGRLAAAPWNQRPDMPTLDRAVRLLDGLPLGLELIAAHPEPLDRLLDGLEAGLLPSGPEGHTMEQVLTTALGRLEQPVVDVLISLAACEGPLTLGQISDWLGSEAQAHVRALAARAIVVPQGLGWRLRNTMRAYLRRTRADQIAPRRVAFREWLLGMTERLRGRWFEDPSSTWPVLQPLLDDIHLLLEDVDEPQLSGLAWWLLQIYETRGPRIGVLRMLKTLEMRLGPQPLASYLRSMEEGPREGLPAPGPDPAPCLELMYLTLVSEFDRKRLDADRLRAIEAVGDPVLAHRAMMLRSLVDTDDLDAEVQLLRDSAEAARELPPLRIESYRRLAWMIARRDPDEALRYIRFAVQLAREHELPILLFRCRWGLASILGELDLELGAEAAIEGAEALREQAPREAEALLAPAGLMLFAIGDDDRAVPLLDRSMQYPSAVVSAAVAATRAALAFRNDEPDADDVAIRTFDPSMMLLRRRDMSRASDVYKRFLEAEVTLHRARRAGDEARQLARVVAEREAEATEEDPSLLRACLASLKQRALGHPQD